MEHVKLCQGEMTQTKFEIPAVAQRQLEVRSAAAISANLTPPSCPKPEEQRESMNEVTKAACQSYREGIPSTQIF